MFVGSIRPRNGSSGCASYRGELGTVAVRAVLYRQPVERSGAHLHRPAGVLLTKRLRSNPSRADLGGLETPRVITADLIYIRFHGPTGRYAGNYTKKALQKWAKWIKDNKSSVRAVYVYFNNDYNAYAVNNAKQLEERLL